MMMWLCGISVRHKLYINTLVLLCYLKTQLQSTDREKQRGEDGGLAVKASQVVAFQLGRVRLSVRFSLQTLPLSDRARLRRRLPLPARHRLRPSSPNAPRASPPPSHPQVGPFSPDSLPGRLRPQGRHSFRGGAIQPNTRVGPVQAVGRRALRHCCSR